MKLENRCMFGNKKESQAETALHKADSGRKQQD
jgi:hypothetical protein